jgi:hypothetical protein
MKLLGAKLRSILAKFSEAVLRKFIVAALAKGQIGRR